MRRRTPPQKRISESKHRFNVAVWGRQSGKTTYGIDKMTYRPLQGRRGGIYWYVLQTSDAAEVAFNRHWHLLSTAPKLLLKKPNESERIIPLANGAQIFYKSGEVLDNLRAETLDGCVIDEYRQQHKELWPRIIRPMLSRRKGFCDFLSTPNGFEHFYDLYEFAKLDTTGEWATFHAPSNEAWWWTPEEIASAKSTMSEAEFAQEILAEFRDLHRGKAYLTYGPHNELTASPFSNRGEIISPYLPIIVAPDFNLSPMAWALGQQRGPDFYWFNEIWLEGSHTPEAARELIARLEGFKSQGYLKLKPQVIICGDATAKAGQRAAAGKSDYDILCQALTDAKITWENRTPDSNPAVKDRVNNMNAKFKAADGSVHQWLHPMLCPHLRKDCQRVSWKPGAQAILDQKTDPTLTHASDGPGYAVSALSPITDSTPVGKLRVIAR